MLIKENSRPNDLILIMGAGDINTIWDRLKKHNENNLYSPDNIAACLAGAWPSPADKTLPSITSLINELSIPDLDKVPFIETEPSSVALTLLKLPINEPIGVLEYDTITVDIYFSFFLSFSE